MIGVPKNQRSEPNLAGEQKNAAHNSRNKHLQGEASDRGKNTGSSDCEALATTPDRRQLIRKF